MAIKDGLSASQRLPMELVLPICLMAAENDQRCANRMAFVSKEVCRLTANIRWNTIVITTIRQFFAFIKIVHAVPQELFDRCMLDWSQYEPSLMPLNLDYTPRSMKQLSTVYSTRRDKRRKGNGISFPDQGEPHDHVRHLFIDLENSNKEDKSGFQALLELLRKVEGVEVWDYSPDTRLVWGQVFLPHPTSTAKLAEADHTKMNIEHLSLGTGSYGFLERFENYFHYEELTIIYRRFIQEAKSRSMYNDEEDDTDDDLDEFDLAFWGEEEPDDQDILLNLLEYSSTKRIHLIDTCTITGDDCSLPWNFLEHLNKTNKSLTHLRYDGPEKAFEPPHFVNGLRPLLEESTLHEETTHVSIYGGNESNRDTVPFLPVQRLKDNIWTRCLRTKIAVGHLEFLHFAWQPRDSLGIKKDETNSPLAIDLRTLVTQKYGWNAPNIEAASTFVARKYFLPSKDRDKISNHAFSPEESVPYYPNIKRGFNDKARGQLQSHRNLMMRYVAEENNELDRVPYLQNGIRAPKSLLELGGRIAFTRQERLTLFQDRARGGKGAWPS